MVTKDLFSLQGRVALVTGGSRGIGKMIAEGFIAQGAKVYISARKAEACDRTAKELSKDGGTCISIPVNVATVAGAFVPLTPHGLRLSARFRLRLRRHNRLRAFHAAADVVVGRFAFRDFRFLELRFLFYPALAHLFHIMRVGQLRPAALCEMSA